MTGRFILDMNNALNAAGLAACIAVGWGFGGWLWGRLASILKF